MLRTSRRRIRVNRYQPPLLLATVFCVIAVSTAFAPASSAQDSSAQSSSAKDQPAKIAAHWDKITSVSKTTATLQVVVNPPLRRGSPIHDNAFKSLHDLQADYVRYVPWLPYPKLGVAELEPPAGGKTSWDFSLIDPMTIDFLDATKGHSVILNFSTIPQWMFKTEKPVTYPAAREVQYTAHCEALVRLSHVLCRFVNPHGQGIGGARGRNGKDRCTGNLCDGIAAHGAGA